MLNTNDEKFAYEFLRDRQTYHSQKENAANAVFLLETGLFGAFIGSTSKTQITEIVSTFGWGFAILVMFVWCLLHVFMRWQLRNRRIAALQVATLVNALLDHLSDGTVDAIPPKDSAPPCHCFDFLDYLVPKPQSTIIGDVAVERYPDWYRVRFLGVQGQGTGAQFGEIFPTYGSITMLFLALAYVLLLSN